MPSQTADLIAEALTAYTGRRVPPRLLRFVCDPYVPGCYAVRTGRMDKGYTDFVVRIRCGAVEDVEEVEFRTFPPTSHIV